MQPERRVPQSFATVSFIVSLAVFLPTFLALPVTGAQTQEPAAEPARQAQYPSQIHLEFHPSPADAERILSSVSGLLNFSSEHSGLPIRSRVQGYLIDREAVKQRIDANLSKEDVAARLQRSSG
ncbi:MAG: hypothetical protein ACLQVL_34780 [Terriglobia bacterium]